MGRIWLMSLAFRIVYQPRTFGFSPGLRNLLAYELRRFWHLVYERDRIAFYLDRLPLPLRRRGSR